MPVPSFRMNQLGEPVTLIEITDLRLFRVQLTGPSTLQMHCALFHPAQTAYDSYDFEVSTIQDRLSIKPLEPPMGEPLPGLSGPQELLGLLRHQTRER